MQTLMLGRVSPIHVIKARVLNPLSTLYHHVHSKNKIPPERKTVPWHMSVASEKVGQTHPGPLQSLGTCIESCSPSICKIAKSDENVPFICLIKHIALQGGSNTINQDQKNGR